MLCMFFLQIVARNYQWCIESSGLFSYLNYHYNVRSNYGLKHYIKYSLIYIYTKKLIINASDIRSCAMKKYPVHDILHFDSLFNRTK